MNKIMCVLPFNSISIGSNGGIRVCCNSDAVFDHFIQDFDVDKIINNQSIVSLRSDFLKGIKNPVCSRCWKMEAMGTDSFRTNANQNYSIKTNSIIDYTENISYNNIQYLDITLGNKCNLACRMCHPFSSSLISLQWKELGIEHLTPGVVEQSREIQNKIIDIINKSPNLSSIYMLGGEPLISEFHDELVDLLIKNGRSKSITLQYNTNLQIDVERNLDKWSYFKNIDLGVSIDGSNETYEYIRWPGKWKKITHNLKLLTEYSKIHRSLHPNIATTVQNLNADNLPEMILEVDNITNGLFNFYFIPVSRVNDLEITPREILINTFEKLNNSTFDRITKINDLRTWFKTVIDNPVEIPDQKVIDFFDMQKSYDGLRHQNLFEVKPHFKNLAQEYGISIW